MTPEMLDKVFKKLKQKMGCLRCDIIDIIEDIYSFTTTTTTTTTTSTTTTTTGIPCLPFKYRFDDPIDEGVGGLSIVDCNGNIDTIFIPHNTIVDFCAREIGPVTAGLTELPPTISCP